MYSSAEKSSSLEGVGKKPKLSVLTFGLAAFFSTLLVYSGATTSFLMHDGVSAFIGLYARATLASALAVAACVAVVTLSGKQIPQKPLYAVGAVLHLVACALFCYLVLAGEQGVLLTCIGGAASGAGCALLCLVWAGFSARFRSAELYSTSPLPVVWRRWCMRRSL